MGGNLYVFFRLPALVALPLHFSTHLTLIGPHWGPQRRPCPGPRLVMTIRRLTCFFFVVVPNVCSGHTVMHREAPDEPRTPRRFDRCYRRGQFHKNKVPESTAVLNWPISVTYLEIFIFKAEHHLPQLQTRSGFSEAEMWVRRRDQEYWFLWKSEWIWTNTDTTLWLTHTFCFPRYCFENILSVKLFICTYCSL